MRLVLENDEYKIKVNSDGATPYRLSDFYNPEADSDKKGWDLAPVLKEGAEKVDAKSICDRYNERVKKFDYVFRNGKDLDGQEWSVQDMYSVPDAPILLPKVVSTVVREAVEPLLIGTTLLNRINYSMGQTILLPATGALSVGDLDIPEGGEYPESRLEKGGNAMIANIGKSGLAVKITEEMIRYSQVDVINMHLRAAGRALARHKEVKIFNMLSSMGVTYYDNKNPKQSVLGVTHGRGWNGSANGSITAEDLFDVWGQTLARGFMADALIVHPLMYVHFLKDPNMRAFAFAAGGGTLFASWTGSAAGGSPWGMPAGGMSLGSVHNINPDTDVKLRNQMINSGPVLPSYLTAPFQIIVTPFVRYDALKKQTDVIMVDRNELGVILVDEDLTTEEWNDPARDIRKIKLRERYCLGMLNEGQNVGLLKNIVNVDNRISMEPARPQISVAALDADGNPTASGGLEEIDSRTAIVS